MLNETGHMIIHGQSGDRPIIHIRPRSCAQGHAQCTQTYIQAGVQVQEKKVTPENI